MKIVKSDEVAELPADRSTRHAVDTSVKRDWSAMTLTDLPPDVLTALSIAAA